MSPLTRRNYTEWSLLMEFNLFMTIKRVVDLDD
jgi:hypothetical protein